MRPIPPLPSRNTPLRSTFAPLIVAVWLALAATGPGAASPDVVISQVYGGGGNATAPYRNDFVELFNRGSAPVSLAGWSIQYASATGTGHFAANPITPLSGTLNPGQYYLVHMASGGTNGVLLPAADATGTVAMAAGGAKVALVTSTTGLACNGSPTACSPEQLAQIRDLVGWGAATFFETAPAGTTANATAAQRTDACTDSDNNAADFAVVTPAPRNSASALTPCGAVDTPPTVSSTTPAAGAAGVALAANLAVTFSEDVTLAPGAFSLSCTLSGVHVLSVTGGPETFTIDPEADLSSSESCTLTINAASVSDQDGAATPMAADVLVPFTTIDACGDPATSISLIQGSGLLSPLAGSSHVIEGIVVADYQDAGQLGGYFVQQEDGTGDGDPATSDGLFVFNTAVPVSVGDKVRVRGTVFEFQSSGTFLTEISPVSSAQVCSSGHALPAASLVTLPVPTVATWEQYEGMLVTIPQPLTVSDTFTLARFGELVLSAEGRLMQPTHLAAPGAPALAQQALNDRRRILLDDANGQQNIDPTRYPAGGLSAANTLRVGDRVNGITGVLDQRFGVYRLQPVGAVAVEAANPRPASPPAVGGNVRVASMNVLNYFNGDGLGGGFPTPRGATTPVEFARQRAKTISALLSIDADIVGLMEIENDAAGNSAVEDLVDGLNAATAPGTYAFIDTGVVGTDEIRVALLYKPAIVTPFNGFALLDSSVDPGFIDTLNRPSLAQTFTRNANGKRITVVVNHLKSKGSDCDDVGDPDTGDGQGNCNLTRTQAATALVQWLATDPTGSGDADVLLIGDMNSYAREDPITAIAGAGYVNLVERQAGTAGYSYVFQGQTGYLDHALASASLAPRVTGVTEWHINADEPVALDYNVEFKTANQVNTFYAPDPFRSADHDPVIVGINLVAPFQWEGFYSPIGEWNTAVAGRVVTFQFSLGGNQGLRIFASGSPASAPATCDGVVTGPPVPAPSASSSLGYSSVSGRYTYRWVTQKAWAGTCRQFIMTLSDGTTHTAMFSFTN
jgi:predicted extracellular nuclease